MLTTAPTQIAVVATLSLLISLTAVGCAGEETISENWPPRQGTVTATVHSYMKVADITPGVELPDGFQVKLRDGVGAPIVDAEVRLWPGGRNPEPMGHDASGRYEIEALDNERIDSAEEEYFFEVDSDRIEPRGVVLRVPHIPLTARPDIQAPMNRSDHVIGEELTIAWNAVPGADCYDVGVREVEFLGSTTIRDCVTDTMTTLTAEEAQDFSYIRVRARRELGDVNLAMEPYFSASATDAEVRIFFIDAD